VKTAVKAMHWVLQFLSTSEAGKHHTLLLFSGYLCSTCTGILLFCILVMRHKVTHTVRCGYNVMKGTEYFVLFKRFSNRGV
jgi:hypothetical protein